MKASRPLFSPRAMASHTSESMMRVTVGSIVRPCITRQVPSWRTTVHCPGSRPERSNRITASTPAAAAGSNTCGSPSTAADAVVGWKVVTMPPSGAGTSSSCAASMAGAAEDYRPGRMLGLMARSLILPTAAPVGAGVPAEPAGGISVTFVGHATVLVRFDGVALLTDPVYSSRLILPKRLVEPGVPLAGLPPLDVVLVSHGHMDHLDVPTHQRLPKTDTVAVVAKNLADLVSGCGYRDVIELAWGDTVTIRDVRITALPVKHWGTRKLWPDDRGYTGFLVEHRDGTVFFPGDTAYFPGFRDYGRRWAIDVALLPIR